jgi:hypothetical protein
MKMDKNEAADIETEIEGLLDTAVEGRKLGCRGY